MVLTGDDDKLIPLEFLQEIADGITGSELVIIPESGHMTVLEKPETVSNALAKWLTSS